MIALGLGPPYSSDDVSQAYRVLAKQSHPDAGGTVEQFQKVQQAFERAQEYLLHHSDRRGWIAVQVTRYVALEAAVATLRQLGAEVKLRTPQWLELSFGEFAQLTETAVAVTATDLPHGDRIIAALVAEHSALRELETIELPGCQVTDGAVNQLAVFQQLRRLNLARTPVSSEALTVVDEIASLESIELDGADVSWWTRFRTRSKLRRRLDD